MAWARLQSKFLGGSSPLSTSMSGTLTSGTVLFALFATDSGANSGATCTVGGNSMTLLVHPNNGGGTNGGSNLFVLATPAGLAGTTPTFTATLSGGTNYSLLVWEVSGISATPDGTAQTSSGSSSGAASIGPPVYGSSAANEYLLYCFGDDGGGSAVTAPGGYSTDPNNDTGSAGADVAVAYKNSTGGTESGQWSLAGVQDWTLIMVAFPLTGATTTRQALVPPQPGSQQYRRFFYRDQVLPVPSASVTPVLNVTAGLAAGTGAALAPGIGEQGGSATSSGAASGPGIDLTPALATAAGAAGSPALELTPALAAGTGAALAPGIGEQGGSATSAGAASSPGVDLTPGVAAGTGTAQSPSSENDTAAQLASGAGTAISPGQGLTPGVATAAGTALQPFPLIQVAFAVPQPGSQQYRRFFYRGQVLPLSVIAGPPALSVSAGLASGTGMAQSPSLEEDIPGATAGSGGGAGGTGTGMTPAPATAAGTSQAPAQALTPGLAHATGTAQSPAPSLAVTAGLASAAATAQSPAASVTAPGGLASGSGQAGGTATGLSPALAAASAAALSVRAAMQCTAQLAAAQGIVLNATAQGLAQVIKGYSSGTSVTEPMMSATVPAAAAAGSAAAVSPGSSSAPTMGEAAATSASVTRQASSQPGVQ